jgi:hypothetical protein
MSPAEPTNGLALVQTHGRLVQFTALLVCLVKNKLKIRNVLYIVVLMLATLETLLLCPPAASAGPLYNVPIPFLALMSHRCVSPRESDFGHNLLAHPAPLLLYIALYSLLIRRGRESACCFPLGPN